MSIPVDVYMLAKAMYYTTVVQDNHIRFEDSAAHQEYLNRATLIINWLDRAEFTLIHTGMGG